VTGAARDVEQDLKLLDSKLEGMRDSAVQWQAEVEDLRTRVPWWINCAACIGSVILVWMGLGQFALMGCASASIKANASK
jgi:hypothetical protein